MFFLNGGCVKECPEGYYYSGGECAQCNPNCKTCDPNNKDICTTCPPNAKYFISHLNKCTATCPDGTYLDVMNNVCSKCVSPCKTCFSKTQCISCDQDPSNSLKLFVSSQKLCVNTCPIGSTVQVDSNCIECDKSCQKCQTTTQNCLICSSSYAFFQGKCVDKCPTGLIPIGGKCIPCNEKCESCGTSMDTCSVCKKEYVQVGDTCLIPQTSCSDGFYFKDQKCYNCLNECTKCLSKEICTECRSGFLIQVNTCVEKCSDGYFQSDNKCLPCNSSCKTCSGNADNCLLCVNDLKFFNNKCLSHNPDGYFYDNNLQIYRKCLPYCTICSNDYNCEMCSNGYYLYLGNCNSSCPTVYLEDISSRKCILKQQMVGKIRYFEFKSPKNGFSFFILEILALLILLSIKKFSQKTFFLCSAVAFLSIINVFFRFYFIAKVYYYGLFGFFLPLCLIEIMSCLINCIFGFITIFYSLGDSDFLYSIRHSNKKMINFILIFIPAFLFDFKLFRLGYSRFLELEFFSSFQLRNFDKIQKPNRILSSIDLLLVNISIIVYSIAMSIKIPIMTDIWYICIESIAFNSVFLGVKIMDLILTKNIDEDFFNQPNSKAIKPFGFDESQFHRDKADFMKILSQEFWKRKLRNFSMIQNVNPISERKASFSYVTNKNLIDLEEPRRSVIIKKRKNSLTNIGSFSDSFHEFIDSYIRPNSFMADETGKEILKNIDSESKNISFPIVKPIIIESDKVGGGLSQNHKIGNCEDNNDIISKSGIKKSSSEAFNQDEKPIIQLKKFFSGFSSKSRKSGSKSIKNDYTKIANEPEMINNFDEYEARYKNRKVASPIKLKDKFDTSLSRKIFTPTNKKDERENDDYLVFQNENQENNISLNMSDIVLRNSDTFKKDQN